MRLLKLGIHNYRNLDGINISFSPIINFIVGENNLGKSNLLFLLNKIFSGGTFLESDFYNLSKPIAIDFTLLLNESEIGLFDDLCTPERPDTINIIALQENSDDSYIHYIHKETDTPISTSLVKNMNIINYDSLRNPKNEIAFDKTKGAGALLNYIIGSYIKIEENKDEYLNAATISKMRDYIADVLGKLTAVKRFNISPQVEQDTLNMLSRILVLKDSNNIPISDTGYGVQFNLLILLSIFEKLVAISKKNAAKEIENETEFHTLLIFDEPEIHLHPYLQRSIIKDIIQIVQNEDEDFKKILKELFGIEQFIGQIIIATHSTHILSDEYTQIIRLFMSGESVKAISGIELELDAQQRKHLFMQFPFVKEAIFSKCVIIVEGESEYGCFKEFGIKMGIDFDRNGIAIIKAGGAESILPLIKMFSEFGITCVGVIDKDKKIEKNIPDADNLFFTNSKCFDSEIVKTIIEKNSINILEKILMTYDSQGKERRIFKDRLNKTISDYDYNIDMVTRNFQFKEINANDDLFEIMYVAWFSICKGILLGKLIGDIITENEIPICYKEAIKKAKEFVDNAH